MAGCTRTVVINILTKIHPTPSVNGAAGYVSAGKVRVRQNRPRLTVIKSYAFYGSVYMNKNFRAVFKPCEIAMACFISQVSRLARV